MNPIAVELNTTIQNESQAVFEMFSKLGQKLFMPKGILTQSAEAKQKAHKYNATIGIATKDGSCMYLNSAFKLFNNINPADLFPYAPTTGKPELRQAWKAKILKDNPSIKDKKIGLPIVTNALTHGLSIVADMFCDADDYVILPDKFWGNYRLTFNTRREAILTTFPIFNEKNEFNVEGLLNKARECATLKSKVVIILNFPNNPTGYTPTEAEADALVAGLKEIADAGTKIITVIDDAYFGLFYENSIKESMFAKLTGVSKNILAIKLDGATKELFVWGFRVGFLTFGAPSADFSDEFLKALEQKVSGCIRGIASSCTHPSQSAVLSILNDPNFEAEAKACFEILKARALESKRALANTKYADEFTPYPFNSGYFLTLKLKNVESEALRLHLLDNYGVGTISTASTDLRVAFSCMEKEHIEDIFDIIYKGCKDLANK